MSIPPTPIGGKPQRYREVQADFHGHVAELLAKTTKQGALDQAVSKQDREMLMAALQNWGALDGNYEYGKSRRVFATAAASTWTPAAG